ncbi:MAG: amidohydrolase family protein [Pseudomonadota bacterium]
MEIITANYALPMTNDVPLVKNGAIAVELGKIHDFGSLEELTKHFPDAQVINHENSILMPGLVNAHCHLDLVTYYENQLNQGDFAFGPRDFIDHIITTIEFKQETEAGKVIPGIQKGIDRLIETGTTCVGDMTTFEGTFKLLREAGLRAVVYPEIFSGRSEAAQALFEVALALVEKYTDATHDRIRVGLAPYAPYLLSRNLLKIISKHAKDTGIQLQIHAAESFAEMEFFFDSQGSIATELFPSMGWQEMPPAQHKTPVQYLSEIDFLDTSVAIVGGLHLSAQDFNILMRCLAKIIYCPSTNKTMKHGVFPFGKLREMGIPIGLGTDQWSSRQGFNLWQEMRNALQEGSNPLPTPKEVLQMATIGSARCLALEHLIGTLEKGKKADYIIVHSPIFSTPEECYEKLVKQTEPHHIKHVVVGGNILKAI